MSQPKQSGARAMWGGRFDKSASSASEDAMAAINVSIDIDKRLAREDVAVSVAHARMLGAQAIVTTADSEAMLNGLDELAADIEAGRFVFSPELEDIHMNIEARLTDLIGDPARRLHTARSRNDQVATGLRLWTRAALATARQDIAGLIAALLEQAEPHTATVMPGFTHMQPAQPVNFAHHLLAYCEMLARDAGRMSDAQARLNECPLGAGALAGTRFPIDRSMTARELGFDRPMANSIDAVSARDFALEALSAIAVCAVHLSRLAEEMTLWASPAYDFVDLADAWSTGSSMMPQKRNPDAAELVRAKTGTASGALVNLLTVMKGLPLAYCKDMQEDKRAVFSAFDALSLSLAAMTGMVRDLTVNPEAMRAAASEGFPTATDLADWLTITLDIPFRAAHRMAGEAVRAAEKTGCHLCDLPLETLQAIDPGIGPEVYDSLDMDAAMAARTSFGGASAAGAAAQIEAWRDRLSSLTASEG